MSDAHNAAETRHLVHGSGRGCDLRPLGSISNRLRCMRDPLWPYPSVSSCGTRRLGLWEIQGQNGEIQEKIHELTLFYYVMHDEPSRASELRNMHVIPVFRPQYFVYLAVFWGRDVQNTDPVFPTTLSLACLN